MAKNLDWNMKFVCVNKITEERTRKKIMNGKKRKPTQNLAFILVSLIVIRARRFFIVIFG